jgi:hypothetical protein
MRILATLIAVLVAAPGAVNAGVFSMSGVERIAPTGCCCGDQDQEREPELSFEALCCCELKVPSAAHDLRVSALVSGDTSTELAPITERRLQLSLDREAVCIRPIASARAPPPPTSLYGQRTSLLR